MSGKNKTRKSQKARRAIDKKDNQPTLSPTKSIATLTSISAIIALVCGAVGWFLGLGGKYLALMLALFLLSLGLAMLVKFGKINPPPQTESHPDFKKLFFANSQSHSKGSGGV